MGDEREQSNGAAPGGGGDRSSNPALKPGDSIGNFRVVRTLCTGLIANYYHVQHIRDLHDAAVAVLHVRTLKDPKFPKRLQNLQKLIDGLDHEGIPKIRECVEVEGANCVFFEPVKGQSLSQYFAAHGNPGQEGLSQEAATRIMAQLLGLLGYVHAQGLDHRDLDSDFVFIQEDGSLRLLGLGLKAALGVDLFEEVVSASVSPLTSNKRPDRINSFDIMSPEYKSGVEEDSRVDVYGASLLGFWLLTGRKPDLANYQKPSGYVPGLAARWDGFFAKALERDREKRYQSCRAALLSLKETDSEPESDGKDFIQRQIDRIPVPKGVIERGELATRIYRLSIIGVVGVSLVALTAQFMKSVFTKEETLTKYVAERVEPGEPAQMSVRVMPPSARLEIVGFDESFLINDGRLDLKVDPGRYRVRLSAPNHLSQIKSVRISEDRELVHRMAVELEPDWIDLTIKSEPGATVSVIKADGLEIELGQVGEDSLYPLRQSTSDGEVEILVKKAGYRGASVRSDAINIEGEDAVLDLPLEALPVSLLVKTQPPGASILIEGEVIGTSPVDYRMPSPDKEILVVAELEGYRSIGRRVEPSAGESVAIDFGKLVPRSGQLSVDLDLSGTEAAAAARVRAEVQIKVGDNSYPYGSPALDFVPEGTYLVRAEHPEFVSETVELKLEDRQAKAITLQLSPRPGTVKLVLPDGLDPTIRVNGKERSPDDNTLSLPALEDIELQLSIRDYLTMTRSVRLQPTEVVRWEVNPVRIPGPKLGQKWTMPYLSMDFVWVPPGRFTMGSPPPEQGRLPNEGQLTEVSFTKGFWAGSLEVTQAQYEQVMGQNPAEFSGAKHPVESVRLDDARRFAERLTAIETEAGRLPAGYTFRLPTEAEWEYSARAGSDQPFHFGGTADATKGNFRGLYPRELEDGVRVTESYGTEPVGSYAPNAFGLFDVHGNVREWTADGYVARLPGGRLVDPPPRSAGTRQAVRGGSWEDFAVRVRSAAREEVSRGTESNSLGFRIFLVPEK